MQVAELMSHNVTTCRAEDSLRDAAALMWQQDCGCVPVVDDQQQLVGMLTDRDACMGALSRGLSLHDIRVGQVMSVDKHAVRAGDDLQAALDVMREQRVRRVPVLDAEERIVGLLSLADIAREGLAQSTDAKKRRWGMDLLDTLGNISLPEELSPETLAPRVVARKAAPKSRSPRAKASPKRVVAKKTTAKKTGAAKGKKKSSAR